ncbi:hypothetical protein [Enterococcus timonensis]|uniref:hypothetical protein n=1 Tax=Enterococcus timonensis TaxID=1852364 RepID=UPI0008DA3B1A|nr:hypothetical protein [Enterococcus timonensis]
MKKFRKSNVILILALLLLIVGGFLLYFKDRYHYFVIDLQFQQTIKEVKNTWQLEAVVDEESMTVQNTVDSADFSHELSFQTGKSDQKETTKLEENFGQSIPKSAQDLILIKNSTDQQLAGFGLKTYASRQFAKEQDLPEYEFLKNIETAQEKVETLLKIYDAQTVTDFSHSFYFYTNGQGNFLNLDRSDYLFWYNGENLAIYRQEDDRE